MAMFLASWSGHREGGVRFVESEAEFLESQRDMLGVLGLDVAFVRAPQPIHLIEAFTRVTQDVEYVVLAGHGDDAGLIISDEMPEQLAQDQPFRRTLTPELVRKHVHLTGQTVIANGCQAGAPGLADAFLASGAGNYVGSTGSPFGYASILGPVLVFYELVSKRTLPEAVTKLQSIEDEFAVGSLYTARPERHA